MRRSHNGGSGGGEKARLVRRCAMVALRKPPPCRMTVAEFLTWDHEDPSMHAWQLIDGEPVAMAPASHNHGSIQTGVAARLWNHLMCPEIDAGWSPIRGSCREGIRIAITEFRT